MNVKFEPNGENYGFDSSAAPDWLMTPVRAERTVWLTNAAEFTAASVSPGIATVTDDSEVDPLDPSRRLLRINGKMAGRNFIEARRGRQAIKRLEVSVQSPITLSLSFHFVSDNANHATTRTPDELEEIIVLLNQIFTPQTNITFQRKSFHLLKFERNLGESVNYNMNYQTGRPMKGHEFDLVTSKRDASAHINIFFVWSNKFIDKTPEGKIVESGALGYSAGGRDILVEDWDGLMDRNRDDQWDQEHSPAWENARMLAHEIGHVLGIADIRKTKKIRNNRTNHLDIVVVNDHYVMGSGPFIPKNHNNIMTAIAKQIVGK